MKCKYCGQEIVNQIGETIKIKELNLELTKPVEYIGSYKDIKIPTGWDLLDIRDAITICDNEKYTKILFPKNEYVEIACKQLNMDKRNKLSRWLYRDGSDGLDAGSGGLLGSNGAGRVIFCRSLNKPSKESKK